ncbi:MAG: hypothetical protein K9J37_16080 [Saprospiraceae bacterium]|nr:hypothetical protein [Saprospiraceae bacterium]MCF8251432.1 hypothetical protein [Saprospiraceae bacterium]MCF8282560.1 hypothetical protein [Bacteroidales bacterium]MCF8313027.1 hypothetical protein [Saprospiraceae bacterium]MCF8441474.1 hypothetical protein [Saprospiraceae bacterium]
MNHYTWTYLGDNGRNYRVGLLHSPNTGHLVIYIGSKIVQIDFKVFDSKEYTFFIEEELVHINLERRDNDMYFSFNIDKKTDTPRNRFRHQLERKHFCQLLIFLGVMGLLVTGIVMWGKNAKKSETERIEEMLAKGSQETVGRVTIRKLDGNRSEISYQFVAGNQTYTQVSMLQSEPLILLVNPMPLEEGDEFRVRYATRKPHANQMLFSEPMPRQIELYKERAASKHAQLNPNAPPGMTQCFVQTAFEFDSLRSLADIFFQDTKPAYNLEHNLKTYTKLTTNKSFLEKMEANCGHLKPD